MAPAPIVFALANPDPEVDSARPSSSPRSSPPAESDYPNQINNVLAFPGVFRGLLDARAREVTDGDAARAADALAAVRRRRPAQPDLHRPQRLRPGHATAVAAAVRAAAEDPATGRMSALPTA